jgi:hypothetical protein
MDVVGLWPASLKQKPNMSRYFQRPDVTWDEWGRGRVWDADMHYAEYFYPLERAETLDEIANYPWPDLLEPYQNENIQKETIQLHELGYAVRGDLAETIFEPAWQIRSMDMLFEDMAMTKKKRTFFWTASRNGGSTRRALMPEQEWISCFWVMIWPCKPG